MVFVLGFGLMTLGGCEEEIPKVDCNKFCDREEACYTEVAVALGAATKDKLSGMSPKAMKILSGKHRERCVTSCNDPKKPKLVDKKWAECLKKSDCDGFASCVYDKK